MADQTEQATNAVAKRTGAKGGQLAKVEGSDYLLMSASSKQIEKSMKRAKQSRLSIFDLERASLPAGKSKAEWSVAGPEGDTYAVELRGVILEVKDWRTWYRIPFDESGGGSPPDCSSDDATTGMGDRSPDGADGAGGPFDCLTCKYGQFGGECHERRAVFLLRPENIYPMLVVLPRTSIKAIKRFVMAVTGKFLDLWDYEVSLTMEKDKNQDGITYHKVKVQTVRRLTDEQSALCERWHDVLFDRALPVGASQLKADQTIEPNSTATNPAES